MSRLTLAISKIIPQKLERKLRDVRDLYFRSYREENLPEEMYNDDLEYYSISFCVTCMNRLYHLKETFIRNIIDNIDYPNIEFVLVNYNSQDGLDDWVKQNLSEYISKGIVNYYVTLEPESFHASKAKNLAHKVAKSKILVNLDGDNFLGKNFAFYINYLFNIHGLNTVIQCKKKPYWGVWGRIALSRENFIKLGGYDESFLPHAWQDIDLVDRALEFGLKYHQITIDNFFKYLSNSRREKVSNFDNQGQNYQHFYEMNMRKSKKNIKNGNLIANLNGWGKATLYKNFTENPIDI